MPSYTKVCPTCTGTTRVTTSREYQGEHPHGGMVEFIEDVVTDCSCPGQELDNVDLEGFEREDAPVMYDTLEDIHKYMGDDECPSDDPPTCQDGYRFQEQEPDCE